MKPKSQGKRIDSKLKSQILAEILLSDSSISKISKKHDLSSTTLYGWRIDHIKKLTQDLKNNQELSKDLKNNFIELLPEGLPKKDSLGKVLPLLPISETNNSKLSEISLIFNNDISLTIRGSINGSSLIKILDALEESC